jgi:hypothetical protein
MWDRRAERLTWRVSWRAIGWPGAAAEVAKCYGHSSRCLRSEAVGTLFLVKFCERVYEFHLNSLGFHIQSWA